MSAFGVTVKQKTIDDLFLTSPGEDLVQKTLLQLSQIEAFVSLFGPYQQDNDQQRWANYQRMDWSIPQLPAISVFEAETETKDSDNAWLRGSIRVQIHWPPNMRRGDLARVPGAFKGVMQNFFASQWVTDMLDELFWIQRPAKVYGLNEYGKEIGWTPETEGYIEGQLVPATMLDVRYRIDLRAWYRALEFMDRTKEDPFETSLFDLNLISGFYDGVEGTEATPVDVSVEDHIRVSNP